jgi:hypothetical protein
MKGRGIEQRGGGGGGGGVKGEALLLRASTLLYPPAIRAAQIHSADSLT